MDILHGVALEAPTFRTFRDDKSTLLMSWVRNIPFFSELQLLENNCFFSTSPDLLTPSYKFIQTLLQTYS
jgi:hypothetical protein